METKNMIGGIVSLAVVVICVAAIMMPVLSDATKTHETFVNEGAFYVEVDPTDQYTLEYDASTDPNTVVINGEDVAISANYTFMALDKSILRMTSVPNLQYKGDGQYLVEITKLSLTISEGSVTGTYTDSITTDGAWPTTTYTKAYIASATEQDLVMTEYSDTPKLNGDSDIFAFGQTSVGGTLYLFKITGTIDDGLTVATLDRTSGEEVEGAVISNLSINKTAVSGYTDLYEVTSITFTVTLADTSTANCTYTAYIVPSEVTAEKSVHFTDAENMLINAIPALVIVALVIGAVGIAITSRRD